MKKITLTIAVLLVLGMLPLTGRAQVSCVTAGDVNSDGVVDIADLGIISTNFNQPGTAAQGDLNGDNFVDQADLDILSANYGNTICPPVVIITPVSGFSQEVSGGGRIPVGTVMCSRWSTTCLVTLQNGDYIIIPNQGYQNGN